MKRHYNQMLSTWAKSNGLNGVVWGIAGKCLYDGAGFIYKGDAYAQSPSFTTLKEVPGGMHTHGFILVTLGCLLIYATGVGGKFAKGVLYATFAYSSFLVVCFVQAWFITGKVVWSAPSGWALVAHLSLWISAVGLHGHTHYYIRVEKDPEEGADE